MSFTLTETIQFALRDESTSSGKNAALDATRVSLVQSFFLSRWLSGLPLQATLKRPEALPSVSIAVDHTGVFVRNACKPKISGQNHVLDLEGTYTLNTSLESLELPPDLSHCRNDYTLASLRLGASVIDRSRRFDTIVRCIRELQSAVDLFNYSNTNVQASALLYSAVEERYKSDSPSIPIAMGKIRDSMLATIAT
ncbi:hypothetical protein BKA70DRAFT_1242036 [Coprinopsis sp. MPI-PUGE-AT-0042]|nr:hypothetical protein BKA70DRAFT_1242036 [Coprinopsis sp. MPI-PUGE-AT-0042]